MIRQLHAQSELRCIVTGRCVEEISAQFSGGKITKIQKSNWELHGIEFAQALNCLLQHLYSLPTSCVHSQLLPSSSCLSGCLSVRSSVHLFAYYVDILGPECPRLPWQQPGTGLLVKHRFPLLSSSTLDLAGASHTQRNVWMDPLHSHTHRFFACLTPQT